MVPNGKTKKIKIIHVITQLGIGGAESTVRDLVLRLDPDRFESIVVTVLPKKEIAYQIEQGGVQVISLDANKYNPFIIWKLVTILKREKPDIVHTQLFHADILGRIAAKIARVPKVISTLQNVTFGGWIREIVLVLTRRAVDKHIAVAQVVLDHAIKSGIAKKEKSSVIYNGVDATSFQSAGHKVNNKTKIIVSTGRVVKQKGFEYLIQAMELLPNTQLIILGEGIERKNLERLQARLPTGCVILAGSVLNVREYLQAADAFVMSSLWEGFSVALIEAGAMGLPVIATPVGIAPELIVDKKNGLIVPVKNAQAIAGAITKLFSLPEESCKNMGAQLRQDILEKFSVERMVSEYERAYEELSGQ